jgi:cytochrome c-type biogenesis protein CcmE
MSRIDDELEQALRDAEASSPAGETASASASASRGSAVSAQPTASSSSGAHSRSRAGAGDVARPVVADAQERKRSWGLLAALLALGGGVLALVFNGGQEAVVYSYQVDEVKAQAADLGERQLRVQGLLVSGTLTKRDNPCEYRFLMRKEGDKTGEPLQVQYPLCVVPDTFRDVAGVAVEVTAEGRLSADGHLQASKIFAKCPSKYEMRESADKMGGKAPQHGGGGPKPDVIPARNESEGIR